jgi:cell division protein FtsB
MSNQKEVEEQAKEIEELTRSRDDIFHELEGYKEHNNQLAKEIERLKGENEFFKRMIRRKQQ